jgi:serine/threonine protein kinase/Flp pilus assembly protein TadD
LSRDRIFVGSPYPGVPSDDDSSTRSPRSSRRPHKQQAFPKVGTDFAGFRLIGELGRGTFGRVYLGRQGELAGRLVALKVCPEVLIESQKLAQLQHTHIVPIHSFHQAGPLQAVCMPFFGSTTLADVLRDLGRLEGPPASGRGIVSTLEQRKSRTRATLDPSDPASGPPARAVGPVDATPLPGELHRDLFLAPESTLRHLEELTYVEAVLWMGACLADGLQHAHERGIIHRDLKPANVLLADDGRPMLLDFNLAEDLHDRRDDAGRPVGGTLPYMSPEHLAAFIGLPAPVLGSGVGPKDAPRVDERSDLYSLGVILTELLIGQTPFARLPGAVETVVPLMIADRLENVVAIRSHNPRVSPAVESILRKCLEADPARRYQTAQELRDDLQRQLADAPLLHAAEPSYAERLQKWGRRHPRLSSWTTASLVGGVLLLSLLLVLVSRARRLDAHEARDLLTSFRDTSRTAGLFLVGRHDDEAERREGQSLARQALATYGVLEDDDWRNRKPVKVLDAASRRGLSRDIGDTLLLMAYEVEPEEGLALNDRAMAAYEGDAPRSLWRQRVDLLAKLGQSDGSAEALRGAATAQHASARDHYIEGIGLIHDGDYAKALDELTKGVEIEPTHVASRFALGRCCLDGFPDDHGRTAEAIHHYSICVGMRPSLSSAWYNRAVARLRLGRHAEAEADFSRALELRWTMTQALVFRAVARDLQDKTLAAIADLDEALKRGGRQTHALLLRSKMHKKLGDAVAAKRDLDEAMRLVPTNEEGWVGRGVARASTDPEGALADFVQAVKIEPRSLPGWHNQASLLTGMKGRIPEAIAALDRADRLFPDHAPTIARRGILNARLGRDEAALKDARSALRLAKASPATLVQVASIYAQCSRRDAKHRDLAIQLLASALRAGYNPSYLATDDLKPLCDDARFAALVRAAKTLQAGSTPDAAKAMAGR